MPCPTRRPACDDSPYECCLRSGRRLFPVRGNASACLCLCLNLLGATAWAKDAPASTGERAPTDSGGEHEGAADSAPAATPESSEASAASTDADAASASYDLTIEDTKGRPVRDARLEIPQLRLTATPKDDGSLQLDVPSGTYEVVVRAPGFAPYHERVEFGPALRQTGLAIYLAYDLGEVVVTGSTVEQLASQSPVRTQVIDRSSIERKGAANLAQALKHQTGVRLENDCQNCNFTQVRMNGMDGRYSQIVINGRPVFSALAGVYGLEQIPTEMIDRIEIVKGGSSALYGGSAIAGVINVVTKRPDRTFASLNLGGFTTGRSWGGHQLGGNAGVGNQDKSLALVLSGALRSREAWDRNGDGFSDLGMHRQHSFSGDLFWDPIPRGTLTLRLQTLGERRRGGDHLDQPEFNVAVAEAATTLRQGGELRWKHTLRSGLSYELGYTMAYTTRDSYYGGGGNVTLPENPSPDDWEQYWAAKGSALGAYGRTRNPVHYGDALVRVPLEQLGEALLPAGMQGPAEQLRDAFPAYSRKVDAHYSDIAAVTELDWHPSTWSEAVLGLRVGKHSSIGRVLMTPRAAVTFTPWSWLKTRTSFSTGYRAPQVFDEDLHITIVGGEGAVVTNVPGLEPARSYRVSQQVAAPLPVSAGGHCARASAGSPTTSRTLSCSRTSTIPRRRGNVNSPAGTWARHWFTARSSRLACYTATASLCGRVGPSNGDGARSPTRISAPGKCFAHRLLTVSSK